MRNKTNHTPLTRGSRLTDAKLLLIITICVFVVMYLCAVLFLGSGFKKPQTFFNILNENAALLILSCGMSLVMITGGIDISVGTLTALVCMSCAVNLDFHGGTVLTAILLALGIGTAFGLVQGFLIAYLEIQPFIVTLAGMFFAKGMTTIVNATQFNVENEAFKALKETRILSPAWARSISSARMSRPMWRSASSSRWWSWQFCSWCSAGRSSAEASTPSAATATAPTCWPSTSSARSSSRT